MITKVKKSQKNYWLLLTNVVQYKHKEMKSLWRLSKQSIYRYEKIAACLLKFSLKRSVKVKTKFLTQADERYMIKL